MSADEAAVPDEVEFAALDAWVSGAGRRFQSDEEILQFEEDLGIQWIWLTRDFLQNRDPTQATREELEKKYSIRHGPVEGEEATAQRDGWVAAMLELWRLAAAYYRQGGESSYPLLLARAKVDPDSTDFTALRHAYARQPDHNPYAVSAQSLGAVEEAIKRGDYAQAISLLDPITERDYLNPKVQLLLARAMEGFGRAIGRETEAETHRTFARKIIKSILDSGSGGSPASALDVISVTEEYAALEALGLEWEGPPTLEEHDGRHFDVFRVRDSQSGRESRMYFKVDGLLEQASSLSDSAVPADSPEYGAVLLSMAKQSAKRGDRETARLLLDQFLAHLERFEGKAGSMDRFRSMAEDMKRELGDH